MSLPAFVAMGFSIAWIIVVIMAHCRLDGRQVLEEREPRATRNRRGRRWAKWFAFHGGLK